MLDTESFLCSSLQHLLVSSREDHLAQSSQYPYVTKCLTYNWDHISPCLEGLSFAEGIRHNQNSTYSTACQTLWPVFIDCGLKLQECETPPSQFWQWTNCESDIQHCFRQMQSREKPETPMITSLHLSAIFEHSLGNVLLLKQTTVPFLLRDLLSSIELQNIFGKDSMMVAHILLGTPLAFNVRNVCWHGFPAPHEIHMDVAASLLVLITSFGKILNDTKIASIPCRPKMKTDAWSSILPSLFSTKFPQLTQAMDDVMEFVKACDVIPNSHRFYWTTSLKSLHKKRYGESLMLLLPALEHTLRCVFCSVNSCPDRVRVAEQHMLYTTMNEILSQSFTKSEGVIEKNNVPLLLGDKVMEMLMDMFDSFAGPRIRDKLSHGECDFSEIPAAVANHMFCVSILVLLKLEDSTNLEIRNKLKNAEENYAAKFHSISLLKTQAKAIKEKLDLWQLITELPNEISSEILELQSILLAHSSRILQVQYDDIVKSIDHCLTLSTVTLYRSKSELSSIVILRKITAALENICVNLNDMVDTRQHWHNQFTLRSRKRKSFYNFLEFVPSFQAFLRCILFLVLLQLALLPNTMVNCRFFKSIQQYAENVVSLTSSSKNKWVETREKTNKFCNLCIEVLMKSEERASNGVEQIQNCGD